MQIGIDSFAAALDGNSRAVDPAVRLRQLVEQIQHADEVGLDTFGVGEHHRRDFLDSAPEVILGAAAARTQQIRLTSAVTVLSAADPVRVFQSFATLDLLSQGRSDCRAVMEGPRRRRPPAGYPVTQAFNSPRFLVRRAGRHTLASRSNHVPTRSTRTRIAQHG